MAITQVANPSSVPSAVADYEAQNAHISAFNNIVNNQPFILTNSGGTGLPAIKLGTYIQYGGNLYVVDTEDYAITGTPVDGNNYIRLSGTTTLTAEWVQDISSYVWNEVYGYKESGSYFLLPYLVVKDGTEYEKYSMALDASFGKIKATSLDTGQGANELYAMNQNLRTTDSPTFATIDTGFGANEVYKFTNSRAATSGSGGSSYTLPSMAVGEYLFFGYRHQNTSSSARTTQVYLPSGGTYQVGLGVYEYTAGGTQITDYSVPGNTTQDFVFNIRRVS